ncbi:hypothetical protein QUH37_25985, partial [Klebsiella pneumoniae]|uniref:hypothetical protein n=1 Tax=Klebsiella pneumoniae TaxID=573 RepID=UPI0025A30054
CHKRIYQDSFILKFPPLNGISNPRSKNKKILHLKSQQVTFINIRPEKSSTAVPCLKGQSFEQSA